MKTEIRYKSLLERSFKQLLRYRVFGELDRQSKSMYDMDVYVVNDELVKKFTCLYGDMASLRDTNKNMRKYLSDHKDDIKDYKKRYAAWFEGNVLSYSDFEDFWLQDDRTCKYCGISEGEISSLVDSGEINTKRLYSRGKTMEIDRIEPEGEYRKDNIILSCYWCNNAKTDEFTYKEFEVIARGINAAWSQRLGREISFPEYL